VGSYKNTNKTRRNNMRKKSIVLSAVLVIAFAILIAPIVFAKPETRLNGDVYIEYVDFTVPFPDSSYSCSFVGTVEGDIEGTFYVTLIDVWFDPAGDKVEHFIEYWRIEPYSGGYIQGENQGKWTFSNFKWVGNGEVTQASEYYGHLIGSKWQYRGTTSDPSDLTIPLTGFGKFHITHNK
jgi:hypothetical protein